MRRLLAVPLVLGVIALASFACDDDDDAPDATSTSASTAAVTPAAATATVATPLITIDEPPADSILAVPFTMSGEANVFEAVLFVDVVDAAGTVLCTRRTMATSGTGTPGTWETIVAFPPPATESAVTLRAYDFSARDGAMENVVERSAIISTAQPNIVITSPGCAEEVGQGTLTVTGMAQVFEAALTVEIRDASGAVLTQNVLAADGTTFSPWTATFDLSTLTPGFYDLVAYSTSAMDGSVINEFPMQINVGP